MEYYIYFTYIENVIFLSFLYFARILTCNVFFIINEYYQYRDRTSFIF